MEIYSNSREKSILIAVNFNNLWTDIFNYTFIANGEPLSLTNRAQWGCHNVCGVLVCVCEDYCNQVKHFEMQNISFSCVNSTSSSGTMNIFWITYPDKIHQFQFQFKFIYKAL